MKKVLLMLAFILALSGCSTQKQPSKQPLPNIGGDLRVNLTSYIEMNYKTPEDYVISKFAEHDIVFLGEFHRIKHDVELVHSLIPLLYSNGIRNLGFEFACYADQAEIDRLITSDAYDEKLAEKMLFDFLGTWGYQEYADVFRAAWDLNRQLPEDAEKFRIVGLNARTDWSFVQTAADFENPDVMLKVYKEGFGDDFMADTIIKEFINKGEKALVYSGIAHAFTKFQYPIQQKNMMQFDKGRTGNIIYKLIGDRCFTIYLHAPWLSREDYNAFVYPADGVIDALIQTLGPEMRRVGFDVAGGPFAELTGKTSDWINGCASFNLGMYCDGYIIQKPLSEYEGVTPIKDFINEGNLAVMREQCPNPAVRNATAEEFNSMIADDTNFKSRFRMFE